MWSRADREENEGVKGGVFQSRQLRLSRSVLKRYVQHQTGTSYADGSRRRRLKASQYLQTQLHMPAQKLVIARAECRSNQDLAARCGLDGG